MKAIQITENGGLEVIKLVDTPLPTLGEGDVLVKAEWAGVNFSMSFSMLTLLVSH